MATEVEVGNLALERLGVTTTIASIEENSKEAKAIKRCIDHERQAMLRDFDWPCATGYVELALVSDPDAAVNYDWYYSYRQPSDCLKARRIMTANGREETEPAAFRPGRDSQGKLIYTDEPEAQLEYTADIPLAEFDPLASSALAWRVAITIAPALSRMESVRKEAWAGYAYDLQRAQAQALNEGQSDQPRDAEWIRGRA